MAYIAMAYIVMSYAGMTEKVMAYIVMAPRAERSTPDLGEDAPVDERLARAERDVHSHVASVEHARFEEDDGERDLNIA